MGGSEMNIDENTVKDIRFILRQVIDCPAKRRILEALRITEKKTQDENGG